MIEINKRQRIGVLIRTLLEIDIKKEAEMIGVSTNSIYQYELGKFNSKKIEAWYDFYYEKLGLQQILINVGCFKSFARWEQYLDNGGKINEKA